MNEILETLKFMVIQKMEEPGVSTEAKKVLEEVKLTLVAMGTKTWKVDDAEYINKQMEMLRAKLETIEKEDNVQRKEDRES